VVLQRYVSANIFREETQYRQKENRFANYEGPPEYPPDLAKFANFGPHTREILPGVTDRLYDNIANNVGSK